MLGILILAFIFMVLLKINGSSSGYWNYSVTDNGNVKQGILVGTPKPIRSDEWLVQTPFALSQLYQKDKLATDNSSLGEGKVPLMMSLPTKHLSSFFRPQNWGFFFLNPERGFSFYWNYKIFGLFISFFLLLMIVTKSNFWISFFGSVWLLFSGFIQWWFSTSVVENLIAFNVIFVSIAYILKGKNIGTLVLNSLLLAIFGVNFVLIFYPPFQVPLTYLLIFLLVGYFLRDVKLDDLKERGVFKFISLLIVALVSIFVVGKFLIDTKDTIKMIMNTAYPGKRAFVGGDVSLGQYFAGYYGIFMSQGNFPAFLGNVCEASNFIVLYPMIFFGGFGELFGRKRDPLLLSLLGYLIIISVFMLIGFPLIISKLTLFSFVSGPRAIIGLGFANIIFVSLLLSMNKGIKNNKTLVFLLTFIVLLLSLIFGNYLRNLAPDFVKMEFILGLSIYLSIIIYLFLKKENIIAAFLISLLAFSGTFTINPINKGLPMLYQKELSEYAIQQEKADPGAVWIVYDSYTLANFLKASGINTFNGVQYTPKINDFRKIDKSGNYEEVYNRYAHVAVEVPSQPNEISFKVFQADLFQLSISPCSQELADIKVKYYLFSKKPDPKNIQCLRQVNQSPVSGTWIYKRN